MNSGLMVACVTVAAAADKRATVLQGGSFTGMQVNRDSSSFERLYPSSLQGLENSNFNNSKLNE